MLCALELGRRSRLVVAGLLCACSVDEHSLRVDVQTDLAPGIEFQSILVRVESNETAHEQEIGADAGDDDFFTGTRAATFGGLPANEFAVVATMFRSGSPLLRREAVVEVSADTAVLLRFGRSCVGVTCPGAGDSPDARECLGGVCVVPSCVDGTQADCPQPVCEVDADCEDPSETPACLLHHCIDGICEETTDHTICDPNQVCRNPGGCQSLHECADDEDCVDESSCTDDLCASDGACVYATALAGTACNDIAGGVCNERAECVECLGDSDCEGDQSCRQGRCAQCVVDADCGAADPCIQTRCLDRACVSNAVADGTTCMGGQCQDGMCTECIVDGDCDDGNSCTDDRCVMAACVSSPIPNDQSCAAGFCRDGACTGCTRDALCDSGTPICDLENLRCVVCTAESHCSDGNPCTQDACGTDQTCSASAVADTTPCPGGSCMAGTCQPSTCTDGLQNGLEQGVDCGTGCPTQCSLCEQQTQIPAIECEALMELYDSAGAAFSFSLFGWGTSPLPCTWTGVHCRGGRVVELVVNGHGLVGFIPPEIGNLTALEVLDLGSNSQLAAIPPEIGQLVLLRALNLNFNEIAGPIPPELGQLVQLETLDLNHNRLSGPIPPELGQLRNLTRLKLEQNQLSGTLPVSILDLPQVETFWVQVNMLDGPIPPEVAGLTQVTSLSLAMNNFTGPIVAELGSLTGLQQLFLNNNRLSGPFPEEITNLTSLSRFTYFGNLPLCSPSTEVTTWLESRTSFVGTYTPC